MNKVKKVIWIVVMLAMVILACNAPGNSVLSEADTQATSVAETVAAQMSAQPPTATTAGEATATFTIEPSHTAPATATNVPTSTQPATATTIPCNKASFVSDINYPDGSEVTINKAFVKTWRLQNSGSCTWTSGYRLIFSHGDRMNAPDEVVLTSGTVAPGETVDISINLTAPGTAGTYKGYFKLKSSEGQVFGIGASGTNPFYVEIKAVLDIFILPPLVITPLFILQPEANVTYDIQRNCSGKYYLKFRVHNTGTIDIQSYSITVKDISANITTTNSGNMFGAANGCISIAKDPIPPGGVGYVTSGKFDFQLIGSTVTAKIKLCGLDDQGGFCTEKTLTFIE